MKKTVLMLFVASLFSSCVGVKGNGNVESTNRQVDSFTSIRVSGAFTVFVMQGDVQSIKLTADANLLPLIETKVSSGTLDIRTKRGVSTNEKMTVHIVVPNLKSVNLSGVCSLNSKGLIKSDNMEIETSGSSNVNLELECDDLELESSGASSISLKGTAENVEIDASGASSIKAYSLVSENADIDISGSSGVRITVQNKINAKASGASSVNFKGNPKDVRQSKSGAASINSK